MPDVLPSRNIPLSDINLDCETENDRASKMDESFAKRYRAMKNNAKCGEGPPLDVKLTEKCGWGVFAVDSIPPETLLLEYTGKLVRHSDIDTRRGMDRYCMTLVEDGVNTVVVDALIAGNLLRYVNGSATDEVPNCRVERHATPECGTVAIVLVSVVEIAGGKELRYNYSDSFGKEVVVDFSGADNS